MKINKVSKIQPTFNAKLDKQTIDLAKEAIKASISKTNKYVKMWGEIETAPGEIFGKINKNKNQEFYYSCDTMKSPMLLCELNPKTKATQKLSWLYMSLNAMLEHQHLKN